MIPDTPTPAGPLRAGLTALALMAAGFAAWVPVAAPNGAIVLDGQVAPAGGARPVQHPHGGRVVSVAVSEGERVQAGDVLLVLGDPALEAEASTLALRLWRTEARLARMRGEAAGADVPEWPEALLSAARTEAPVAEMLRQERAAFAARGASLAAREQRLAAEAAAASRIAEALAGQADATADQAALIAVELADQERLLEGGLTQASRVNALRREAARLRGAMAEANAARERAIAAADAARLEATLMRATEYDRLRTEIPDQEALRDDLAARLGALAGRIDALTLQAPVTGVVQGLGVAGPGAVLAAGAPALHILPDDAASVVAARLWPGQVEGVVPGMAVEILLAPGPGGELRRIAGRVTAVSPDPEARPGLPVRFHRLEAAPVLDSGSFPLKPGMPAGVRLSANDQQGAMAALVAPLARAFARPDGQAP